MSTTKKESIFGDKVEHLAFGSISANRVNGQRDLYGSDVSTGGWVKIEISNAVQYDDAFSDFHFGGNRPLIKVALSEAQWVSFVSRMNIGGGTKCTLDFRPAPDAPMIAPELPKAEMAAERMGRRVQQIKDRKSEDIKEYAAKLMAAATARLSKKELEQFRINLNVLVDGLYGSLDYGVQVLTEHKEDMVKDAMVEIDAALKGYIHKVGVDTIRLAIGADTPIEEQQKLNPPSDTST